MDSVPQVQDVMLEFRAGKMSLEGTLVVPDTRKGLVRIGRGDEGLVHFQWLDRGRSMVEDEPDSDRDSHICDSVNYFINGPLDMLDEDEPDYSYPMESGMPEGTADEETSSRAGNLVGQDLATELVSEATSSVGPVQLADLQRILSSIRSTDAHEDPEGGFGLGDILKPDLLLPLIETLPLENKLTSYLPEGSWTLNEIMELLQSPPFRQQVETFSHVLRTGQVDLAQFGIDPSKYKFTVLSFLEALDDTVANSSGSDDAETQLGENSGSRSQGCSGGNAMDES